MVPGIDLLGCAVDRCSCSCFLTNGASVSPMLLTFVLSQFQKKAPSFEIKTLTKKMIE
uniref:Uncharacterized protein n=1 Tax=Nelumbo nucifera TaxID=4432 RepID=A0A822XH04_NELNU|nr:TPA_asm: hypothetical protein HUJ06_019749 [Nelumbo nucifera]